MPRRNILFLIFVFLLGFFASQFSLRSRTFMKAVRIIERNALEEVDRQQLLERALEGMVSQSPYFPYTAYLPPEEGDAYEDEIQGVFAGIGVGDFAFDEPSGELWITPVYNSPAWEAGLRFGDRIVAINEKKVEGCDIPDVLEQLQGDIESSVHLTVRPRKEVLKRYGGQGDKSTEPTTCEIDVKRGSVQLDIVCGYRRNEEGKWVFTLDDHPEIGYVRIEQFTDETPSLFDEVLKALKKENIVSLIIDLRGNPGGFLDAAVSVSSRFLPKGTEISTIRKRGGVVQRRLLAEGGEKYDWKLVVLIDDGSASASEIVSGALVDNERAISVGTRSHGKGTVQELYALPQDMGMIRLTCASFNRPNGKPIHRTAEASDEDDWGISPKPENIVELDEYQTVAVRLSDGLRSLPPIPEDEIGPMTRLIFDRARKRDIFSFDKEPQTEIPKTDRDFTQPASADPQFQRAVEILTSQEEA